MRRVLHEGKLAYFETSYRRFPSDVRGLDWSGVYFQKTRFDALVDGLATADPADSILDVGCGRGDLSSVLEDFPQYVGIDRVPHEIEMARQVYPARTFHELDLSEVSEKFDWVLASQILNHRCYDNYEMLMRVVGSMWRLCRRGVGFNVRIAGGRGLEIGDWHDYDPGRVLTGCRKLTRSVTCRMDYLPHDATFHLFR